jgi:glucose/arabinose dehydrogenase
VRRRAVPVAIAAAIAAATALTSIPATATDQTISAVGNTFVPANVTMAAGSKVTFTNADIAPHNVIADATGKNGPLFASSTVTAGQSAEVKGAGALTAGAYTFHCSVHPNMRGSLTVTKPGATLAVVPTPTGVSVPTPTAITVHDGSVYVVSYTGGAVLSMPIGPGGTLGATTVAATNLGAPLGVAFGPDGTMYVSDSHPNANGKSVGRVWAVKGTTKTTVVDNLPNGRHYTNNLAVQGNRLYVTNGSATDDGVNGGTGLPEQPLNGTLLSYALPVSLRSKPTVESRGLRNVYDVAFRPGTRTEAWFATNGPDALDPYGEDLLHKTDVAKATTDYGFPACVYKAPLTRGQNPAIKTPCRPTATPELALGLHVSADGLAFGNGGAWGNDLYVTEYGSNAPPPAGHKVVRIPIVNGKVAGPPQDVVVGPAPLDVAFGPDGLYVIDFDSGSILLLRAVAA